MIKRLENMFLMQQKLNDDTCGIGWEQGFAKNGKMISFRRCVYMECAELIDSFDWKHWKLGKNNFLNVKIELVDIWHFIMSLLLEETKREDKASFLAHEINSNKNFISFCKYKHANPEENIYMIINDIESIIHKTSGFSYDIEEVVNVFFALCVKCGLSFDELYSKYIGKNVLNKFRQEHGYNDGTYKKVWNDLEDNEVMSNILKENQNIDINELYTKLEEVYSKI